MRVFESTAIPPNCDLTKPEAQAAIATELYRVAQTMLAEAGEIRMPYYLLALRRDPRTGEEHDAPEITVFSDSERNFRDFERDQDEYLGVIRHVARVGEAVAVGYVMEVWKVPEADQEKPEWAGRYDQHPERWAEVFLAVEHAAVASDLVCEIPIVESGVEADGERWMGEPRVREAGGDPIVIGGRFAGILNLLNRG